MTDNGISRRLILLGGLALTAPAPAWAAMPPGGKLAFAVSRNGAQVGEHHMSFAGDPASPVVTTDVRMLVKLGPVPVYRYIHHAVERWAGGRFASLETTTDANGKGQKVSARRTEAGLTIETGKGRIAAPANAAPFTHWNPQVFGRPLFNPQEGKLLKVTAARNGAMWSIRGEAEIDDWYDEAGVWTRLRGKLKDGSTMEYRRL
jgi:hypothetical protein